MAKALYSGVGIAGMSGSINKNNGGTTFSKNGVVRRRVIPTNPATSDQQEVRNAFAFYTAAFSGLSSSEVGQWESARTGNVYYLKQDPLTGVSRPYASAKDLFIAMNMNLDLSINGNYATPSVHINVPTAPTAASDFALTSVVADDSSNTMTVTYTGAFTGEQGFFRATLPVSNGTQRFASVASKLRNFEAIAASPDAIASYVARYPLTGMTGKKIYYEIIGIDTGSGKQRQINAGFITVQA
jgi:hypothetical protein